MSAAVDSAVTMSTMSPISLDSHRACAQREDIGRSLPLHPHPPRRFLPSPSEFRHAMSVFARGSDGQVVEADVELMVRLAYGPNTDHKYGWREHKRRKSSELDNGLVPVEAVLTWIDLGGVEEFAPRSHTGNTGACTTSQSSLFDKTHSAAAAAASAGGGDFCRLVETFNQFDCDSNGVICARDLKFALSALEGESPSLQECRRMVARVDANCDGVVDLEEFVAMMRSGAHHVRRVVTLQGRR